jgi:hypothetical protein
MAKRKEILEVIPNLLKNKLVPYIVGAGGIGKSDLAREIATKHNLKLIDIRPTTMLCEDLSGFARIKDNKSEYVPFNVFPLEGDPIEEGTKGFLLFIDEFDKASKEMQAGLYKLILDRQIGNKNIHNKCYIVCAGNRQQDNAFSNPMSAPMKSRLIHIELDVSPEEWLEYAQSIGIDKRIIAFIDYKKNMLINFDPNSKDLTYSSPRTWIMLSKIIKNLPNLNNYQYLISGTVGESVMYDFFTFTNLFFDLPTIQQIINKEYIEIPNESAKKYAIVQHIIEELTEDTLDNVAYFIDKFPGEFKALFLKKIASKFNSLITRLEEPKFKNIKELYIDLQS